MVPRLALIFLLVLPASALAQCSYPVLAANVPVSDGNATSTWSFTAVKSWGAVAVRSAPGSNHDLAVFQNTAGSPACVANQVGASTAATGVDLVVGDFRPGRNTTGPWYPKVTRVAGAGPCTVEGDSGNVEIVVDAPALVHNTGEVINVYQVFLEAGVNYIVDFNVSPGVDAKVLIFRNPAAAPYWAGRSSRLLESTGPTTFLAPASDEYAVVVVNDDGGFANYSLAIDQCQPPIALTSGTAVSTSPPTRYRMDQSEPYWSAVGVRGTNGDDWNVIGYKTGHGADEPVCFEDSTSASSTAGTVVDFILGDFTYNPLAPFYARMIHATGTSLGVVEWDDGPDEILVNGPLIARSTDPSDVLEVWDVFLEAGSTYSIYFERAGAASTRFLVFENALQSDVVPYWAGRSGAVLTGTGITGYSPAVTGYHGIVVVNDNGGTGTYKLTVYGTAVGVAPDRHPARARIDALVPNPSFARTQVAYTLPRAGRVAFDVLDVSGRRVAHLAEVDAAAGPGRATWDGRGDDGSRVRAGVYFMRMTFEGRASAPSKLVVLP